MSKYAKLGEALKGLAADAIITMPLMNAQVISIEGESCTIKIGGLELDEVRIKATINGNTNKLMAIPKVGSMVLVGSLTGDLKDLAIVGVDEVAKIMYEQDGLVIEVDSETGKIAIANDDVNMKGLFQQLAGLLKQFKVFTPAGPSGTPLPDTITSITQFETDFKKLLK